MISQSRGRAAYTMLEISLVIALIVIISAMAAPAVRTMYRSVKVEAGADVVQTAIVEARLNAIDHGRPYRVAIVPGQWNIRVAPELPEFWSGGGEVPEDQGAANKIFIYEGHAPEGASFHVLKANGTLITADPAREARPTSAIGGDEWKTVAVLFPDGSAHEDVKVFVTYDGTAPMVLSLRALTGSLRGRRATEEERNQLQAGGS